MSKDATGGRRLGQIKDILSGSKSNNMTPWDPASTNFPSRSQLPPIAGAPKDAAWFWGDDDQLGRLNLLTPGRVAAAAKEIKTGEIIPVNLPLNEPSQPALGRETFKHEIKTLVKNRCYDDLYHMNTQSGTQWDGFRHFAQVPSLTFYNGVRGADIVGPDANMKDSIHHWAEHGIAGRGVLLDYAGYASEHGIRYGGDIQIGDLLFIRFGWTIQYFSKSLEERARLGLRPHREQTFAGLAQTEEIKDWLHDCYFAAVASDTPTLEAWPSRAGYHLHECLLALWGMPIGEMLDLERLTKACRRDNRWVFFFTSMPANCPGGVSSHVNGQAIL